MKVLGFDAACIPSTEAQSVTVVFPSGGIFTATDPAVVLQSQEQRRLVDYVEQRFVHFIEPDWDWLH
jgi:hypothetical protein